VTPSHSSGFDIISRTNLHVMLYLWSLLWKLWSTQFTSVHE
jgi:hypothetical protein